jgi:RDD family protein
MAPIRCMSTPESTEAEDPYRIPETELVEVPLVEVVESASKWRRFFNWLIDRLVIYALITAAVALAYAFGGEPLLAWVEGIDTVTDYAISYAMTLVYYTIMEGVLGFSVGKLITATRAVDAQGRRLTFGRSLLRSLCRLIPFNAVSLLLSDDDVRAPGMIRSPTPMWSDATAGLGNRCRGQLLIAISHSGQIRASPSPIPPPCPTRKPMSCHRPVGS